MSRKPTIVRSSETDITIGVLVIAAFQPTGIATFYRLKIEIPNHVRLSQFDTAESITRTNEEMWVQQTRNIIAHRNVPGNFIHDGYLVHIPRMGFRITPAGLRRRMQGRAGS